MVSAKPLAWTQKTALVLTVIFLAVALVYIMRLRAIADERRNSYFSVSNVGAMAQALHRMEVANTGFLLTGNNDFREPFNGQRDILSANYKELVSVTVDDPTQQEQLKLFKAKLTQWFALYNPLIIRNRSNGYDLQDKRNLTSRDRETLLQCKILSEAMLTLLNDIRATQEQKSGLVRSDGAFFSTNSAKRSGNTIVTAISTGAEIGKGWG